MVRGVLAWEEVGRVLEPKSHTGVDTKKLEESHSVCKGLGCRCAGFAPNPTSTSFIPPTQLWQELRGC